MVEKNIKLGIMNLWCYGVAP